MGHHFCAHKAGEGGVKEKPCYSLGVAIGHELLYCMLHFSNCRYMNTLELSNNYIKQLAERILGFLV